MSGVESQTSLFGVKDRIQGMRNVTFGGILLSLSMLIGLALALFSPQGFPWIIIWATFFGWLAVWGGVSIAMGTSNLIEAKIRLGRPDPAIGDPTLESMHRISVSDPPMAVANPSGNSVEPFSVTDATTRQLHEID